MKKIHTINLVITIILAVTILIGVSIQIISPRSIMDSTFEIIGFLLAGVSVFMALISQFAAYKERKESNKIIRELHTMIKLSNTQMAFTESTDKKLNEIIAMDRKLLAGTTGRQKPKNE